MDGSAGLAINDWVAGVGCTAKPTIFGSSVFLSACSDFVTAEPSDRCGHKVAEGGFDLREPLGRSKFGKKPLAG